MPDRLNKLPVTSIIRLQPKPGLKQKALHWFHTISEKATLFKGHSSSDIFEAVSDHAQPELIIIIHFDTYANSLLWEHSTERATQIAAGKELFEEIKPGVRLAGIEYWFDKEEAYRPPPPPKWKMMVLTVVIIFALLNTLLPLLSRLFSLTGWPRLVNSFLSIVIMVALITYIVMPFTTKILSGWLFKRNVSPGQAK